MIKMERWYGTTTESAINWCSSWWKLQKKIKELLKMIGPKGTYKDIGTGATVAKDIKVYYTTK